MQCAWSVSKHPTKKQPDPTSTRGQNLQGDRQCKQKGSSCFVPITPVNRNQSRQKLLLAERNSTLLMPVCEEPGLVAQAKSLVSRPTKNDRFPDGYWAASMTSSLIGPGRSLVGSLPVAPGLILIFGCSGGGGLIKRCR